MSIKADPSASCLAVIRRPEEHCDESTEDRSRKEKGLIGSVELGGFTEEEEGLQETVPQGRKRQQGSLLSGSLWGGQVIDTVRGDRGVDGGSGERYMRFPHNDLLGFRHHRP